MISKSKLEQLAVFGGPPAFGETLHVGRPNIGDRTALQQRIDAILDRRWLTNDGPCVRELEQRLADLLQVRHCIAVVNGTFAIEAVAKALGLAGEVIVPSFTFIASAHAFQWLGITPVFCEVDPRTHNIDPREVERLITPRTSAILGVHVWGRPCAPEALADIAHRRGLKLVFDAAHAFACSHRGRMIGNFGDAETFSFHATKFFNTLEGGAVTTNDNELAQRLRLARNFGFAGYDNVSGIGSNGKMCEIAAAMGLTSLESLELFIEANRRNYSDYAERLSGIPGVRLVRYDEGNRNNFQYVVLEFDQSEGCGRDELHRVLQAENVLARRYFFPACHQMEPYRSWPAARSVRLPQAEALSRRVLSLPSGTAVGPKEVAAICDLIRLVSQNRGALADKLAAAP